MYFRLMRNSIYLHRCHNRSIVVPFLAASFEFDHRKLVLYWKHSHLNQ